VFGVVGDVYGMWFLSIVPGLVMPASDPTGMGGVPHQKADVDVDTDAEDVQGYGCHCDVIVSGVDCFVRIPRKWIIPRRNRCACA